MSDITNIVSQALAKSFGLTEQDTTETQAVEAAVNQLNKSTLSDIRELRQAAREDDDADWAQLMLDFGKSLVHKNQ